MALDPVNAKAVKGKFKDREDKDLDNDGDSDASDEYLHKRRSAVSKAIKNVKEAKLTPDQMRKALDDDKAAAKSKDKVSLKKAPWDMKKEEVKLDEKYDTPVKKKPVSMMTKDEKDKNDERRKSYKEYQKSLRKEEVEIDEALAPNVVRGDNYVGVPDRVVALAKEKVKKTNPSTASDHSKAMHKALSEMGWEMTVGGKYVRESNESVSRVFARMVEAKDNYTVAHKSFSSAVQHAEEIAKKRGFEIDPDVWDRKVAMGPRKPGVGKTNSYNIDLMKNGKDVKQKLHMQVYCDEGRYELNMYIS